MPDLKALRILFDTYWSPAGWRDRPTTAAADFAYAVQAGVMFEPVCLTHDAIIDTILRLRRRLKRAQVSGAFLASLTTRRLDLRSVLGSFAVARHLPRHSFSGQGWCRVCGESAQTDRREDVNVLNFERFKWGGVRHQDPLYIACDLEWFAAGDRPAPTPADRAVLREIVQRARSLPADARPRDLEKTLASVLDSNKAEREVLIHILGYCGILQPAARPGFFAGFVNQEDRAEGGGDWQFPACWWRGSDGVDAAALAFWFPEGAAGGTKADH